MGKNNASAPKAENTTGAFSALKAELAQSQQQQQVMRLVAEQAASRLLQIENSLSPQLLRNPKLWNIIFHFKEIIAVIREVIRIINEFKQQYITPPTPPQTDGTTK